MGRALAALLAAEWILIFKTWLPPRTLFLLFCMAVLRFFLYTALPNFMGGSMVFFVAVAFLIWHLKAAYRGETSNNLDTFQTPDTGIPRLVVIARNLKLAEFLELGIVVAYLLLYVGKTPLYWPNVEYSPDTKEWLYENALTIATLFAWMSFFGIIMWNRVNVASKVSGKKEPETQYKAVRPQAHNKAGLDSVNELMKTYDVDNRDF